ncbi:hypothetical protein N2U02_004487 [Salmonella enterica]|nr:hypothetical protein [Salmonella enterica]
MRSMLLCVMVVLTGSMLIWGGLSGNEKVGFNIAWTLFLIGSQIVGALESIAHEIRMNRL